MYISLPPDLANCLPPVTPHVFTLHTLHSHGTGAEPELQQPAHAATRPGPPPAAADGTALGWQRVVRAAGLAFVGMPQPDSALSRA
eukprot:350143-Chlamydomonas_euryale.AAC.1